METELIRVIEKLKDEAKQTKLNVLSGGLDDYASYRYYCGMLYGLSRACDLIEEFIAKENKANV
jgi:hypothetical protein